jgi:RimJ/RimL family protein N-acetyltransferase
MAPACPKRGGRSGPNTRGKVGKGYCTEALAAAVAWADRHLESPATACIIRRENHASFRVAKKIGYAKVLRAATDAKPETLLMRPRAA